MRVSTINPVLSGHSKKTKTWFSRPFIALSRFKVLQNAPRGTYCGELRILQYFRPSLSYNFPLIPLFSLFFQCSITTGFTVFNNFGKTALPLQLQAISAFSHRPSNLQNRLANIVEHPSLHWYVHSEK